MSKFKSASKKRFDEIRKRLQGQEEKSSQFSDKHDSIKFQPKKLSNQQRSLYVVRFLPNIHVNEGQDEPWVEAKAHMFYPKGSSKKTYLLCPTTKDEKAPCPICERAKKLFAEQNDSADKKAKSIYKKRRYFANVLVLKDPRAKDENQEGQVLIWEFGKKIFDKLTAAMTLNSLYFWDVEDGANFNLVITEDGGYPNYDSSDFDRQNSSLSDSQDLDKIYASIHNINEKCIPESRYKTYEELEAIFNGEQVVDKNTKDKALKNDEPRKTRTRDTTLEEVEEKEETPADLDKAFEDESSESSEEDEEEKSNSNGDDIDISDINFDDEDLF